MLDIAVAGDAPVALRDALCQAWPSAVTSLWQAIDLGVCSMAVRLVDEVSAQTRNEHSDILPVQRALEICAAATKLDGEDASKAQTVSLQLLNALSEAYPLGRAQVELLRACGGLPLEIEYPYEFHPVDWEKVTQILEITPLAAAMKDSMGKLPLEYAVEHDAPQYQISALCDAYPEPVSTFESAVQHRCWSKALSLLTEDPEELMEEYADGNIALHLVVEAKAPLEVVSHVVGAYPEAVRKTNTAGKLPADCAGDDTDTVREALGFLNEKYDDGMPVLEQEMLVAVVFSDHGRVAELAQQDRLAVNFRANGGTTGLMIACINLDVDMTRLLLEFNIDPEALDDPGNDCLVYLKLVEAEDEEKQERKKTIKSLIKEKVRLTQARTRLKTELSSRNPQSFLRRKGRRAMKTIINERSFVESTSGAPADRGGTFSEIASDAAGVVSAQGEPTVSLGSLSVDDVTRLVSNLNFKALVARFKTDEIDGEALLDCNTE